MEAHLDLVMWGVVLYGLYLRIRHASRSYFNGDETYMMIPALQDGLYNVYKAALPVFHPPLNSLLLHFMAFFGSSELYFRMPAVMCGALLGFAGYKWMTKTAGKTTGLISGCILTFAPPLLILSAQLRSYTMQALLMVCSLYCLERAIREKSQKWMGCFGASAVLATFTEYMSVFYLGALGIYMVLRLLKGDLPRPLVIEWVITQAAVLTVLIIGYSTQFHNLRGNVVERYAREMWLRESYFHSDSDTLLHFLRHATLNLFRYAFANIWLGPLMLLVFVGGVGLLLLGRIEIPKDRQWAALSIVLPFPVTAVAGTLGIYPYGGSRHDVFLLVFMAAGISVAISALARNRVLVVLLAVVLLVPIWLNSAQQDHLDDVPQVSKREQMKQAIAYLASRTPRPRVLVTDQLGFYTLDYYICHGRADEFRPVAGDIVMTGCSGYLIITLDSATDLNGVWTVPSERFPRMLAAARSAIPNMFTDPVWVFYVSLFRFADETAYNGSSARFGKLEIYRISP